MKKVMNFADTEKKQRLFRNRQITPRTHKKEEAG